MEPFRENTKVIDEEPDLLDELLIQSVAAAQYGQRWLDAGLRGQAVHLLEKERARHGSVVFPVWEYLADLAHHARVSLDTVLAAFDLDSRPVVSARTAARIASVLRRIGCGKRESLQMMRLSFADVHGFPVRPELTMIGAAKQSNATRMHASVRCRVWSVIIRPRSKPNSIGSSAPSASSSRTSDERHRRCRDA